MTTPFQTARIYDLPEVGGFLVLDHIVGVWIDPPYRIVMGPTRHSFLVWARTTHGADVLCHRAVDCGARAEGDTLYAVDPDSPTYRAAEAEAAAFAADLRAAIIEARA